MGGRGFWWEVHFGNRERMAQRLWGRMEVEDSQHGWRAMGIVCKMSIYKKETDDNNQVRHAAR